jgi:hypothetical protein
MAMRRSMGQEIAGSTPVGTASRALSAFLLLIECVKPWALAQGRFLRARPLWAEVGRAGAETNQLAAQWKSSPRRPTPCGANY